MADNTLSVLTFEREEKVIAVTSLVVASGLVEDLEILTDVDQDDVYLIVNRSGARYVERFAKEAAQRAPDTCALLDAHKVVVGPTAAISGATHLAGRTANVWADGKRRADVEIDGSGNGYLDATYYRVVYGLGYEAEFKTVKLAHAATAGTAVGQTKIVHGAGLVLSKSCLDGIMIGSTVGNLDPVPEIIDGVLRQPSQFFKHYDGEIFPVSGDWGADARLRFTIDSTYGPCTVQGLVLDIETRDGASG
jgi:hypothetical protein